jgi:nuclear GTP-binding protein
MAAARSVLQDWNTGRIPYYTLPPKEPTKDGNVHLGAQVVQQWSEEFNLDQVSDQALLEQAQPTLQGDTQFVKMVPGHAEVDMDAIPVEEDSSDAEMDEDIPDAVAVEKNEESKIEYVTVGSKQYQPTPSDRLRLAKNQALQSKIAKNMVVDDEEQSLNPQYGKSLKKEMKKKRKAQNRLMAQTSDDMVDDDAYDFQQDYFQTLPGDSDSDEE